MTTEQVSARSRLVKRVLTLASFWISCFGLFLSGMAQSDYENYTFTTLAGPSESPAWYDGTAQEARFGNPFGCAVDSLGNLYVSDRPNQTIRKISPAGMVTTLAGLAEEAGSTDGTGAAARFDGPFGVAADRAGNVYIADTYNSTIRKITTGGVVTTIAGLPGVTGSVDGTGSSARFNSPIALAADAVGNLYVADQANSTIRKVTSDGQVTTLAGSPGRVGSQDGTGTDARFANPYGVAVDSSGNVFVADTGNHTIRKITPTGVVSTIAGMAGVSGSANGTGNKASFHNPFGVAVDGTGKLCVADTYNHLIRLVTPAGAVTTLAGTAGEAEATDGKGSDARFNYPTSVVFDESGNIDVMDYSNNSIRKVTPAGVVTTLAGVAGSLGVADGAVTAARFNYPADVALDANGNAYVADYANQTIRKVTPAGAVTTLAGKAGVSGTSNGGGSSARFNGPIGVAVDGSANVYVTDSENNTIRKITPSGSVSTIAGLAGTSGTNDATGSKASFFKPYGVAVDSAGNVFVADTFNHTIRKITSAGVVSTFAGKAGTAGTNDGFGAAANFNYPSGLKVDRAGNLFVADGGNHLIRRITSAGEVTTLAGTAGVPGNADGGGTAARFNSPFGLALNSSGEIFIGDLNNNLIRKLTPEGKVTTLGGSGGLAGTANGTGVEARFNCPEGLAVAADGTLFIADACNHAIRKGVMSAPDKPVVDLPIERPGVIRHLDVTNRTATAWTWRIIRYPSASSAQLSSSSQDPTFTPDLVERYQIRFDGTDNSGRRAIRTLEITGAELTSPRFDAVGVSSGSLVLSGSGGFPGGTFALLWTTNVSLPINEWSSPSSNRFDGQGNFALTNEVSFPERYYRIRVP